MDADSTPSANPARLPRGGRRNDVTIRDVAGRAGVSVSTVSAVLNQRAGVSPASRAKVKSAISDLGYRPDANARNLRLGRAQAIGLMVPDLTNPFFALIASGAGEEARKRGFALMLHPAKSDADSEFDPAMLYRVSRLDGWIVNAVHGASSGAFVAQAGDCPLVVILQRVPGSPAPFVGSDNHTGARAAARLLLEAGHRRFGVIRGPVGVWSAEQRLAGYREELIGAGLDIDSVPIESGGYDLEGGARAAQALLSTGPDRPTALLVANDMAAIGAVRYCATAGIRVPEEVSLVGFDGIPLSQMWHPRLSTIGQDAVGIGRAAARLLIDGLGGSWPAEPDHVFPTTVIQGETVAAPPST